MDHKVTVIDLVESANVLFNKLACPHQMTNGIVYTGKAQARTVLSFYSVFQVIGFLEQLVLLDISMNKLESLPPEIQSMKSLTDLYLTANELLEVPENIGNLFSSQLGTWWGCFNYSLNLNMRCYST